MSFESENAEPLRERLSELRNFARTEFAAQRDTFKKLWALDEAARVRDGHCLRGLLYQRRTNEGHLRFTVDEDETDFREGDLLRLHTGDPLRPLSECSLVASEEGWVQVDHFKSHIEIEHGVSYLLDRSYFDLENTVLGAIDELGGTMRGRERILPLLLGDVFGDEIDGETYAEDLGKSTEDGFNDSQAEAIAQSTACEWCSLVQGPPGTGKTRVLAQIVSNRLARGERILITAFTHRAIHQALRTLKQLLPHEERIVKVGGIIPDPNLPVPQYNFFAESPLAECESGEGYVVGATAFACRSKRLKGIDFDTVVIDEASQMTLMHAVMAMLSAERYVIIGDPEQLPPVLQSCQPSEAKEHSIFQSLRRKDDLIRLNTTYRMNAAITEWSSELFYQGDLHSHANASSRRLNFVVPPTEPEWIKTALDPEKSLAWIEHDTKECRHYCMEEVDLVHQLIGTLLRSGFPADEIAVLTPFRKQARAIRRRLQQASDLGTGFLNQVVVDTVERIQGQERDLIIMSCAANEPSFVRAVADFLFLPSRLNVSITRARSKAIVLAGLELLHRELPEPSVDEALVSWQHLREQSDILRI